MIKYTKLRDGSWGVRSTDALRPGEAITVVKKDGGTEPEVVDRVLWSGDGVWLATVRRRVSAGARAAASQRDRPGRNGVMPGCASCRQLGRMCRTCSFDEYDN